MILKDKLGYVVGDVEIPQPPPIVLIWGEAVYLANGDHYLEVSYFVVPDTHETSEFKIV